MFLPEPIITAILEQTGMPGLRWKTARKYKKKLNRLRTKLQKLSDDFARTRSGETMYPDAYFAYNFPMSYMKTRYVLNRVQQVYPGLVPEKKIEILDIGCGEGAGLLGIFDALPHVNDIVLHGLDVSRAMVKTCRRLLHTVLNDKKPPFRIRQKDVADGLLRTRTKYDIILLSNSLIEINARSKQASRFLGRISKNLKKNGMIIIIEPAIISASRRLMELRNHILEKQKITVILPCLHSRACPLSTLRKSTEWCHQSIGWCPPEYLQVINQELNRDIKFLKFSYLVVSRCVRAKPDGYVVISFRLQEKGRKRCFLCTASGRIELVRQNKDRSPVNKNFDRIGKGAIITLDAVDKRRPDYWVVKKTSRVKILQ